MAQQYLLHALNATRTRSGLSPLAWSEGLAASAAQHAEAMRAKNTLAHRLGLEADLPERAIASGLRFSALSENVGVAPSVVELHKTWVASPLHRENMLDPAVNTVGIAVLEADGVVWGVEDFAVSITELSLSEQEARIDHLLQSLGVVATSTDAARTMCSQDSGYIGRRPAFVMRFQSADLARLPQALIARLQRGRVSSAAVGACEQVQRPFEMYRVAVVLYP